MTDPATPTLGDYNVAARTKQAIHDIAHKAALEIYQRPRQALAIGFDFWASTVELQYPGEDDTFIVPFPGTILPASTDATVRVAGTHGDRYIDEVFGPAQFKTRNDDWVIHLHPGGLNTYEDGSFFPNSQWPSDPTEPNGAFTTAPFTVRDNDLIVTEGLGEILHIGPGDLGRIVGNSLEIEIGIDVSAQFRVESFGNARLTVTKNGDLTATGQGDFGIGLLDNNPLDLHGFTSADIRFYDGTNLRGTLTGANSSGDGAWRTNRDIYLQPTARIRINNNAFTSGIGNIQNNGSGVGFFHWITGGGDYVQSVQGLRLDNSGVVWSTIAGGGFNMSQSHVGAVDVNGQAYTIFYRSTTAIGSITQVGTTGVAYNTTSDARLKNILDWASNDEAIAKFMDIEFKLVEFKNEPGYIRSSVIAQQLLTVDPSFVTLGHGEPGDDDFEPMMVDYGSMSVLYGGALQGAILHLVQAMEDIAAIKEVPVVKAHLAILAKK